MADTIDNTGKSYYDEIISIPALTNEGKSYCEKIISTDELLAKRSITSTEIWEAEYMQNPIAAGGQLYSPSLMTFMNLSDIEHITPLFSYATIDPADKGGDYFAAVFVDVIPWDNNIRAVVRDVILTRDGLEVACALVKERCKQNKTQVAFVENNGVGAAACYMLKDVDNTEIRPYTATENKVVRILSNYEFIRKFYIFDANYKESQQYNEFLRHLISLSKDGKNKNDDSADVLSASGEVLMAKYENVIYGTL
jgi:hypothetical protein